MADKQHTLILISTSSGGWKPEAKVPADSMSGEDLLPGSQTAVSSREGRGKKGK